MNLKPDKNLQLRIGIFLLASVFLFMAVFALLRGVTIEIDINAVMTASPDHLLGTDDLGRDFLSCLVYGACISLAIGITVVLVSASVGTLLGMVSGLAGGATDIFIMRTVDIILAFPGILLAIALVSLFRQGIVTLILVLSFSGWVGYARIVRGEVLKYKQKEFILAARSYNASFFRIIFSHLLPIVRPLVVVQVSLDISGVILAESSLNFLGIGLDPEIPTLGQLIDAGRIHLFDNPQRIFIPGLVLFCIIIAFNFIGEGLRKKFTKG